MLKNITKSNQEPSRVTIGLVIFLALVLAIILLWPSSKEPAETLTANTSEVKVADRSQSAPARRPFPEELPSIPLNKLLRINPFEFREDSAAVVNNDSPADAHPDDLPHSTAASGQSPSVEDSNFPLERPFPEVQVAAILRGPQGRSALIDGRVVREGEWIDEGLRVVEIRADRVILRWESEETVE